MASNIGTSASSFATTNLKPAPNDQIDALWAQNIADNTAHSYFKEISLPIDFSGQRVYHFRKTPAHNCIKLHAESEDAVTTTAYARVWPAGTNLGGSYESQVLSGTFNVPAVAWAINAYQLDISSLTNGNYYSLDWTSSQDLLRAAFLTHGTGAIF